MGVPGAGIIRKATTNRFLLKDWKPWCTRVLLLTQQGVPITEIAKVIKKGQGSITQLRSSQLFHEKLEKATHKVIEKAINKSSTQIVTLTQEARDILTKAAPKAAETMVVLSKIGTKDDKIKFDACKDILDRAGLKPVEVIEARDRVYTPAEIAQAQGTLLETEAIIMRLRTKASPYILRDSGKARPASSDTESSDAPTDATIVVKPSS